MSRLVLFPSVLLLVALPVVSAAQSRTGPPPSGGNTVGTASPRGDSPSSSAPPPSSGGMASPRDGGGAVMSGSSANGGSGGGGSYYGAPASARSEGVRSGDVSATRSRTEAHGVTGHGQPVPGEARPRGDRPALGTAMPRAYRNRTDGGGPVVDVPINNWSNGWSYWGTWFGDYGWWQGPWLNNVNPWNPNYLLGAYYAWGPWWTYGQYYLANQWLCWSGWDMPTGGYGYQAVAAASYSNPDNGSIRLKVTPKNAEVWVDGYFEGNVGAYDGLFRHLDLKGGLHRVEIKANGYETLSFDIRVMPGRTVTYSGELKAAGKK